MGGAARAAPVMTQSYSVFGLHVVSDRRLPGLVPTSDEATADVRVWLDEKPPWASEARGAPWELAWQSPVVDPAGRPVLEGWKIADGRYHRFQWVDGCTFILDRKGRKVWGAAPRDVPAEAPILYLQGAVMAYLLRLRGRTCLHASAVAIGDRAVAILGPPGAGKSTTAAALGERGHPLLSDDVVVLDDTTDDFSVLPAYPRIRLWPESAAALYGSGKRLPRLSASLAKRYIDLRADGRPYETRALPLAAVYLLAPRQSSDTAPSQESITDAAGLVALVANSYGSYFLEPPMRAREFQTLGRLMRTVPVRKLTPHAEYDRLPALCDLVVDDAAARPAASTIA